MTENIEVVRRMYEAFHAGDAEGSLAYFDPDVTVDASRRLDAAVGQGHEFLIETISRWVGAFDHWHEEIEEIRGFGHRVFVVATQYGRGKGSGVEVKLRYALVYGLKDAMITRLTLYDDEAEALEAATPRE